MSNPQITRELGVISAKLESMSEDIAELKADVKEVSKTTTSLQIKAAGAGGAMGMVVSVFTAAVIAAVKNGGTPGA